MKISIIVPVYNTCNYLSRCLDSLVNQEIYQDIEIIVIDDGSTDESPEIIRKYAKQYTNIKPIFLPFNTGVSTARNIGLNTAKGEYIGFLDSDDYVDNRFFSELYNYRQDFDIIMGPRVICGLDGIIRKGKSLYGNVFIRSIIKREFLVKTGVRFTGTAPGEDTVFKNDIKRFSPNIGYAPDNGIYYYYCKRHGSLSNY